MPKVNVVLVLAAIATSQNIEFEEAAGKARRHLSQRRYTNYARH